MLLGITAIMLPASSIPTTTTTWTQEERSAVFTVRRVLDEPDHPLQPLPEDALCILDVAIDSSVANTADDIDRLFILVSRSISWLEKALDSGSLCHCRESDDALEDWACLLVQLEEQQQQIQRRNAATPSKPCENGTGSLGSS